MRAAILAPTNATFGGWNTFGGSLPAYFTSDSINFQAVLYSCDFSPSFIAGLTPSIISYNYMRQLYDYVKLYKVKVCLKSTFNPRANLTQATGSTEYDFTNFVGADPVITYIDYDGWTAIPKLGATGSVVSPTNGDMTQALMGRKGARRHKAFASIYRTFYPKQMMLVAGADTTQANPTTTPNLVQGGKLGWMNAGNLNIWGGNMIIAIPYVGQTNTTSAYQPKYNYTIANKYYFGFKCPLYT